MVLAYGYSGWRFPYFEVVRDSFVFFFSGRSRHTRFSRDWSSDVCSSDLAMRLVSTRASASTARRTGRSSSAAGSEERRVGKECRCRWAEQQEKKKRLD